MHDKFFLKQAMSFQSQARSLLKVRTFVIASLSADQKAGSWKLAEKKKREQGATP
jgi:hypothetical protein